MNDTHFGNAPDRLSAGATKWLAREDKFANATVLPMWVADMEFATAPAISEALSARAKHPTFGYTEIEPQARDALRGWLSRRHAADFVSSEMAITDALLPTVSSALLSCTAPGDSVVVMPPIYPPLLAMPSRWQRQTRECPLLLHANSYHVDWDTLESLFSQDSTRALLWCSPHNPIGRVWTIDECRRLLELARQHNVAIISDEAHADLVTEPDCQHRVMAALADASQQVVSIFTPGKTFNTQGLGMAGLASRNRPWLSALLQQNGQHCPLPHNPFSLAALQAGYEHGEEWLMALLEYLAANRALVAERLAGTAIVPVPAQATYLVWLDARSMGLAGDDLADFFLHQAGLGLNPGAEFGEGGDGFMRMNIAVTRSQLNQALDQLLRALQQRGTS